jgi:hypothetical protein
MHQYKKNSNTTSCIYQQVLKTNARIFPTNVANFEERTINTRHSIWFANPTLANNLVFPSLTGHTHIGRSYRCVTLIKYLAFNQSSRTQSTNPTITTVLRNGD